MKLAEGLSHPHTLVFTICHARGFMDLFRRCCEDTSSYARLVVSICNENGFLHWVNVGVILGGWAAVRRGQLDRGMEALREGMAGWQKVGARLWMPMFLTLEAETYLKAGRDEPALRTIEQALVTCEHTGERWALAEVLRVKARILLSAGNGKNYREIEAILLNSLESATPTGALLGTARVMRSCAPLATRRSKREGSKIIAVRVRSIHRGL